MPGGYRICHDRSRPTGQGIQFDFYPSPNSILFWDLVVLSTYLLLNIVIGWVTLDAEYKETTPPKWIKPLIIISIPWAVSIHTVTAFIYSGLGAQAILVDGAVGAQVSCLSFCLGAGPADTIALVMKKTSRF